MAYVVATNFNNTDDLLNLLGMNSPEGPATYNGLELDVSIVNPTRPDGSPSPEKHLLKIGDGGDLQDDVMSAEFIADSDTRRFSTLTDQRGKDIEDMYLDSVRFHEEQKAHKTLLNQIKTAFGSNAPRIIDTLLSQSSLSNKDVQTLNQLEQILDPSSDLARIQSLLNENRLKNHPFLSDLRSKIIGGTRLSPKQRAAIGKFEGSGTVDQTIVNRLNAQLKKSPNNRFLKSLKSQALSGRNLSQKQLDALGNFESGKKRPAKKQMTVSKFQTLGHHDKIKVILDHLTPSQFTPKNRNFKSETAKLLRELKKSGMRGTPLNRTYTSDELGALREIVDHLSVHNGHRGNTFLESLSSSERRHWVEGTFLMY